MDFGHALQEAGFHLTVALANDAFADGPGAPRRMEHGDFNPDEHVSLLHPGSTFKRRYGLLPAGVEGGTKGPVDGGEKKMDLSVFRAWVASAYPHVDLDTINEESRDDALYVQDGDGTVYSKQMRPWLLANGHDAAAAGAVAAELIPAAPDPVILAKLDALEGKVDRILAALESKVSHAKAAKG